MRALIFVAVGVVFLGEEFRVEAVDVLIDPVGWALVGIGAWLLGLRVAAGLSAVAALASTAGVGLSFEYVLINPETTAPVATCPFDLACLEELRYADLSVGRGIAVALAAVIGGAALVLVLRHLRTEVGPTTSHLRLRTHLRVLELVVPVVWVLPIVIRVVDAVSGDGYDPVWNGPWAWISLARNLVMVWLAIVVLVFANAFPKHRREQRFDLTPP